MTTQTLRESVLDFMTCNPIPWRTNALADKLGVDVKLLGLELSQLNAEGELVSCTVEAPGSQPQREYRIAANVLKLSASYIAIRKETNARSRQ